MSGVCLRLSSVTGIEESLLREWVRYRDTSLIKNKLQAVTDNDNYIVDLHFDATSNPTVRRLYLTPNP